MNGELLRNLFQLRLAVGRFGEMDNMKWWNTNGMLGRYGEKALSRGLPRTHFFAQARTVFKVATHRSKQVFTPPNGVTLWDMPADIERDFEEKWHQWMDENEQWEPFFRQIKQWDGDDLVGFLTRNDLLTDQLATQAQNLRRSAQGQAVLLSDYSNVNDESVALLAAGFCRGEPQKPAIPYVRMEG
ncbi:MAG: BrxE family protein [Candidatus Brocadiia bacterium]